MTGLPQIQVARARRNRDSGRQGGYRPAAADDSLQPGMGAGAGSFPHSRTLLLSLAIQGAISMKRVLGLAVAGLVAVFAAGPLAAQERDWQELERYSIWMEEARAFYAHSQSVSMEIEMAETLIDEHVAGSIPGNVMQAEVEAVLQRTGAAIDEIEAALAGGLGQPDLSDPQLRRAADTFAGYLQTVDDELREQQAITRALLTAALAGDWTAYDRETARSLRLTARSLRSEGTALAATMEMQDPAGPTHALSRTQIALYEPTAVQLELLAAFLDGQPVDFGAAYVLVEASVFEAKAAIVDGLAATQAMHGQARAARNDSSVNPAVGEFLTRVASSYDRSFEIEKRLLETVSELQLLMLDRFSASEPIDDAFVEQLMELVIATDVGVLDRFNEQNARLADVQNLAAVMQQ